jgi:hypothetical protein
MSLYAKLRIRRPSRLPAREEDGGQCENPKTQQPIILGGLMTSGQEKKLKFGVDRGR